MQVMIHMYNVLHDNKLTYNELLEGIERSLTRLFCDNSQTIISNNRIDIFDKHFDKFSNDSLYLDLIESSNNFKEKNRRKIINAILSNAQRFERVLSALNYLHSEGDKLYLRGKITDIKLSEFLKDKYVLGEIEEALIASVNTPILSDVAEQIVNYIDNNFNIKSYDAERNTRLLFHIKLILAYRKKDVNILRSLVPPELKDNHSIDNLSDDNAKRRYFEILFLIDENKLNEALKDLNELVHFRPKDPSVVTCKLHLKILLAKQLIINDSYTGKEEIRKALEEFEQEEKSFDTELYYESIKRDSLYNKLECLDLLEWDENFDAMFYEIKRNYRFSEDFASLIVKNKIRREQWTEARKFVVELTKYHRHYSNDSPNFIKEINFKLSNDEKNIEHLKNAYVNLLSFSPEKRIKVLPDVISPITNNYGDFLLYELLYGTANLQQKLFSLLSVEEEILHLNEDKVTDLLESILNARLSAWGLQWNSQARIGKNPNDTNNLARPDLSTRDGNLIYIAEALRIYPYRNFKSSKKDIRDHIIKTFDGTATRKYLYYLIYYQSKKFADDWVSFKKELVSFVKFPKRFGLVSKIYNEVTVGTTPDLKAMYLCHNDEIVSYYIFINLRYASIHKTKDATTKSKKKRK